ncbi:MAG TPA: hypothetical protein ENJ42_08225 [Hellea balneolensis]|uniref:Uncharacterized protein n=1 Tax=Hellea balneolensis TaxID=287478 RepID=A0A7C5M108_9PROT|nr:hypothetical protein [Hellea balneolensis]
MNTAVEMMIEPGAQTLITQMGRKFGTKARSKVMDKALEHLRTQEPIDQIVGWFSEDRILAARRTTVRLSAENAAFAHTLAEMTARGRPSILLDIVYLAASRLGPEDYEALR